MQHFEQAHQTFADRLGEDTRDTLDAHCELIKAYEAQSLGDKAAQLRQRYLDIFQKHVARLGEDPDEDVFRNLSWTQASFHQAFGGSDRDARDMTRRLEELCAQYGREFNMAPLEQ